MRAYIRSRLIGCAMMAATLGAACQAEAKTLKSVGVTVVDLGNPFFGAIAKAIGAKVKEVAGPTAKTLVVSGDYDLGKQSIQIDNFIQSGVDLIVISAVDSKAIGAAIKRAEAAGIAVVAVDNTADNAQATITTDNVTAGKQACGYLVDKLGGQGNLLIVNGPPVSGVIDRVKAARRCCPGPTSRSCPTIRTASGPVRAVLTSPTPCSSPIPRWTGSSPSTIHPQSGPTSPSNSSTGTGVIITTVDGSPDVEGALRGDTAIVASSAQLPAALADAAVQAGRDLVEGKTLQQPSILVAPKLITRDNVSAYKGWNGN